MAKVIIRALRISEVRLILEIKLMDIYKDSII